MEMIIFIVILTLSCIISVSGHNVRVEYDDDDDESPPGPREIPDKYYDSLMQELPELVNVLAEYTARRKTPAYKEAIRFWQGLPSRMNEHGILPDTDSFDIPKQSGRRIYQQDGVPGYWEKFGQTDFEHVRINNYISHKELYHRMKNFPVISCYWCGMNITDYVPRNSLCHDAFETADYRLRAVQRFFRGKCYYTNPIYVLYQKPPSGLHRAWWPVWVPPAKYFGNFQSFGNFVYGSLHQNNRSYGRWGIGYFYDYGLKRNYFGQYTGGCFKRYLDVGSIYTQRGCRHLWPKNVYGLSSVGHRYKRLELVLRYQKDKCISSNHASLVPFNRGISLFAKFHVCVCPTRYCNRAANSARLSAAVLLMCRFIIHLNFSGY